MVTRIDLEASIKHLPERARELQKAWANGKAKEIKITIESMERTLRDTRERLKEDLYRNL